jgi:hypothetical protein
MILVFISFWTFCTAAQVFKTTDSFECKANCIDKNLVFCPYSGQHSGLCCDVAAGCTKADFCSSDAPSPALKYWACPFDTTICGVDYLLISSNVTATIKPQGSYQT